MTIDNRKMLLEHFVNDNLLNETVRSFEPLQGDAGNRLYFRVKTDDKSYIAMDCPPTYCSIEPFIKIGNYLRSHGFSVPNFFHFDVKEGFMIIEDFGDLTTKAFIESSSSDICKNTYYFIIDALVSLQEKTPPGDMENYHDLDLSREVMVFAKHYIPYALGRDLTKGEYDEYQDVWRNVFDKQIRFPQSLVLKDFHTENIMYLKDRGSAKQRLGLLDFQDAIIGSPIYDLVSILEDARIRVSRDDAIIYAKYFAKKRGFNFEDVMVDYHILGAQRNSRILGIFARKFVEDGDDTYLKYIPLVINYLKHDISHPSMILLKKWFERISIEHLL